MDGLFLHGTISFIHGMYISCCQMLMNADLMSVLGTVSGENVEPTDDPRGFRCICAATGNPPVNGRCPGKESPRLKVNFLKKKKKFGGHKSLFVGPLKPLFWTSGDVFSGFQSQDGQPYSHLAEAYVIYLK